MNGSNVEAARGVVPVASGGDGRGRSPRVSLVPRRTAALLTVVVAFVASLLLAGGTANAAPGYSLYAGSSWNVRSCPATCDVVGGTISGAIPDLVCQTAGPAVTVSGFGTSTIYDLVRTPVGILGYISDLGVAQTLYAQFTPGLPRCTSSPGPATEAATGSGYGWIVSCSGQVLIGQKWACWKAALRYLFLPDPAS
jgi:hypothetical protein